MWKHFVLGVYFYFFSYEMMLVWTTKFMPGSLLDVPYD